MGFDAKTFLIMKSAERAKMNRTPKPTPPNYNMSCILCFVILMPNLNPGSLKWSAKRTNASPSPVTKNELYYSHNVLT